MRERSEIKARVLAEVADCKTPERMQSVISSAILEVLLDIREQNELKDNRGKVFDGNENQPPLARVTLPTAGPSDLGPIKVTGPAIIEVPEGSVFTTEAQSPLPDGHGKRSEAESHQILCGCGAYLEVWSYAAGPSDTRIEVAPHVCSVKAEASESVVECRSDLNCGSHNYRPGNPRCVNCGQECGHPSRTTNLAGQWCGRCITLLVPDPTFKSYVLPDELQEVENYGAER